MNGVMLVHFSILCSAIALNLLALLLTLTVKNIQVWPPPGKNSWQFWFTWVSFGYLMVGIPVLGILDYGSLGLPDTPRFISAVILFLIALPGGLAAIRQLSFQQTVGLKGEFISNGVYSYSRNPQYVTHIVLIAAVVLTTNSILALYIGVPYALWFILAPFSEEPWLKKQFGETYTTYCRRVPRFFGLPKKERK